MVPSKILYTKGQLTSDMVGEQNGSNAKVVLTGIATNRGYPDPSGILMIEMAITKNEHYSDIKHKFVSFKTGALYCWHHYPRSEWCCLVIQETKSDKYLKINSRTNT